MDEKKKEEEEEKNKQTAAQEPIFTEILGQDSAMMSPYLW